MNRVRAHSGYTFLAIATAFAALAARAVAAAGQGADGSTLSVALLSVGPGHPFVSWMGHAALVVTNARTGQSLEFDYGVVPYGIATRRGLITGVLTAYAAEHDANVARRQYVADGRSIRVQSLALTPVERLELLRRLVADQGPGRQGYLYDYRMNNCTTRIRDLLDDVTGGTLRRAGSTPAPMTLRVIGHRYAAARPLVATLFDLAMNNEIDQPITGWDAAVFPDQLADLVARAMRTDSAGFRHPLADDLAGVPSAPVMPKPRYYALFLLVGVAVGSVILLAGVAARAGARTGRAILGAATALVGGVLGTMGLLLAAAWIFTSYTFARHNANLLLLNPMMLAAVPLGVRFAKGSARADRWLRGLTGLSLIAGVGAVALHFTGNFAQDNWQAVVLVLPILAGTAGAFDLARPQPVRTPGSAPVDTNVAPTLLTTCTPPQR